MEIHAGELRRRTWDVQYLYSCMCDNNTERGIRAGVWRALDTISARNLKLLVSTDRARDAPLPSLRHSEVERSLRADTWPCFPEPLTREEESCRVNGSHQIYAHASVRAITLSACTARALLFARRRALSICIIRIAVHERGN